MVMVSGYSDDFVVTQLVREVKKMLFSLKAGQGQQLAGPLTRVNQFFDLEGASLVYHKLKEANVLCVVTEVKTATETNYSIIFARDQEGLNKMIDAGHVAERRSSWNPPKISFRIVDLPMA